MAEGKNTSKRKTQTTPSLLARTKTTIYSEKTRSMAATVSNWNKLHMVAHFEGQIT